MWETLLSWHAKCSLLVAGCISKTRVLIELIYIHGWPPHNELIYIDLVIWQKFAEIAYSPKSPDSPTWLATTYWTNLHTFGNLTRICRNRHIRQNGWPPRMEVFYIHLAIWQNFPTIAIFAKIVGDMYFVILPILLLGSLNWSDAISWERFFTELVVDFAQYAWQGNIFTSSILI